MRINKDEKRKRQKIWSNFLNIITKNVQLHIMKKIFQNLISASDLCSSYVVF